MPANQSDLDTSITNVETSEAALATAVAAYMTAVNSMINRFLAKLAAGNDFTAEKTRLDAASQHLSDLLPQVNSAIAQAESEGN